MKAKDKHWHRDFLSIRFWISTTFFFLVQRILNFLVGASASAHIWQELCKVNTRKAIFLSLVRGLSTVGFNETTRIVKPNIRQRYKSGPPDALEIYQKAVLKWNLENYESPNRLVQQGVYFFPLPIRFSL